MQATNRGLGVPTPLLPLVGAAAGALLGLIAGGFATLRGGVYFFMITHSAHRPQAIRNGERARPRTSIRSAPGHLNRHRHLVLSVVAGPRFEPPLGGDDR